jgi:23S rRNA (cytosine1962-C5)-methyltransferase
MGRNIVRNRTIAAFCKNYAVKCFCSQGLELSPIIHRCNKGMMADNSLADFLDKAFLARPSLLDPDNQSALRLFAGFYEGEPRLLADIFAGTLLLTAYCESTGDAQVLLDTAQRYYQERIPWLSCVIQKQRLAKDMSLKCGKISFGSEPAAYIRENGIRYALDLTVSQGATFYLDTRALRVWLKENSRGLEVLNTFAYTGSLGVAALAGGAARVVQVDRNAGILGLARRSAMLNRLDLGCMKLRAVDVFSEIGNCKKKGLLYDLALLDPPFFSVTEKGKVDLVAESARLINKVRPLIKDGGLLVAINNALFLSGREYMQSLESLCRDGYLEIEQMLPVPEDSTGFPWTIVSNPPISPAPFNHPTKIVIMRVKRK